MIPTQLRRLIDHAEASLKGLLGNGPSSRTEVGYLPLDTLKPVAEDIHIVDSLAPGLLSKTLPARMTVIRLPGGNLLLHSPTRFRVTLKSALERLGPIRHLVAPNLAHWSFLPGWQRTFPEAITWAAPGVRERSAPRKKGVRVDRELGDTAPAEWGGAIELVIIPGAMSFHEAALFHKPTRTLVLADTVINLEPPKIPAVMRPVARLFGMVEPDGMPPPYVRAIIKRRREAAQSAVSRLLDLHPERVIFAHGRWFEQEGEANLRRSMRWLLDGARS